MLASCSFRKDNYRLHIARMDQGIDDPLLMLDAKPVQMKTNVCAFNESLLCIHLYVDYLVYLYCIFVTFDDLFFKPAPHTVSQSPQSLQEDIWQSMGQASMHDSSSYTFPPHNLFK